MVKIVMVGLTAVFLILILKNTKPEFGAALSLFACVVILFCCAELLSGVVKKINDLVSYVRLPGSTMALLLKIIGVSYLAEFGSELCRDAGQSAIAGQIELAGKLVILSISLPVILSVFEEIVRLF